MNDCFEGYPNVDMSKLDLRNNRCFCHFFANNIKLKKVKFPDIEIHNIKWFYYMFYNCESLTTIDMTFAHNNNAEYCEYMFYGCKNLEKLYLPNFHKYYNIHSYNNMFNGVPKNTTMYIGESFYNFIKYQLVGYNNAHPF